MTHLLWAGQSAIGQTVRPGLDVQAAPKQTDHLMLLLTGKQEVKSMCARPFGQCGNIAGRMVESKG